LSGERPRPSAVFFVFFAIAYSFSRIRRSRTFSPNILFRLVNLLAALVQAIVPQRPFLRLPQIHLLSRRVCFEETIVGTP
jgi:hypothetical protein